MSETQSILGEAFNIDTEEGSSFDLIAAGSYVATITEIGVTALKTGKGDAIKLTWEIQGGAVHGRLVFDQIIINHVSAEAQKFGRQKLKDICDACGATGSLTDLNVLRNKPCSIWVKIEHDLTGNYAPKNRVGRVRTIVKPNAPGGDNGKPPFNDSIPF